MNVLVAYLRQLASVPGAENEQGAVAAERVRVGEHIAKSTCHICHSAAGPNPTAEELYNGAIPPLSSLAERTTRAEFVRKVTHGAPITMGAPPQLCRGRMPVFYYLTEEEAADVYLYLTRYPPYPYAVLDAAATNTRPESDASGMEQTVPALAPVSLPAVAQARTSAPGEIGPGKSEHRVLAADAQLGALPVVLGLFAVFILGSGFALSVYAMTRLPRNAEATAPRRDARVSDRKRRLETEMVA
jgi:mono/diheme cytochrome c family protein